MTQFASTLYPRTNPTNPVLLKFREIPEASRESWASGFMEAAKVMRFAAWSDVQAWHAVRVLTRLGALTC